MTASRAAALLAAVTFLVAIPLTSVAAVRTLETGSIRHFSVLVVCAVATFQLVLDIVDLLSLPEEDR
jgi:heme/copper-type cytochrome/quinol oxidase subunit 4